jgi:hypothetical protein
LLSLGTEILTSLLLSKKAKIRIYKSITLPVVLNGCETWSLALRKEYVLRVLESRMLRGIFGPKRDGPRDAKIEVGRYVARMAEKKNV